MATQTPYARLLDTAEADVRRQWGSAFDMLGQSIQRALLTEQVTVIASSLDSLIDAEAFRQLVQAGRAWAIDKTPEA